MNIYNDWKALLATSDSDKLTAEQKARKYLQEAQEARSGNNYTLAEQLAWMAASQMRISELRGAK